MKRRRSRLTRSHWIYSSLLSGLILAGCGASQSPKEMAAQREASAPMAPGAMQANSASTSSEAMPANADAQQSGEAVAASSANPLPTAPQLIKTAELSLEIQSIDEAIGQISRLIKQYQGDILGLQAQDTAYSGTQRTATLQLRVPQQKLDSLLTALTQLGEVRSRSLTAEDVTSQLVDLGARLRNLQKAEATLLQIMERSGSVSDVLKVAQELAQVRQSIEQIAAQQASLQNQVAYSRINLNLSEPVNAPAPPTVTLPQQLWGTWQRASHSVGEFTVGLIKQGIWLIAYSPYLLIIAVGGTLVFFKIRRRRPKSVIPPHDDSEL